VSDIIGIHHLGLTVTDVERSARWYVDTLGFEQLGQYRSDGGERHKIFLRHSGLRVRLGLVAHETSSKRAFDETEVGLDHLAFAVPSRADLEQWAERLAQTGVKCSPIAESFTIPGAAVLVFRDPDNIQLELFTDPNFGP
jgi:catechol 2,3-dioxygenase-like lactoylglutathione lyase family enzyme